MSGTALGLVVAAAFAHALWNLYAKRAGSAGLVFVWSYTVLGALVYTPVVLLILGIDGLALGFTEVGFILGSMLVHTVYFLLLQHGYMAGDLSVVYPVARGVGPVLAIVGGVLLLGERPSLQALAGGLLVCVAVAGLGFLGRAGPLTELGGERISARRAFVFAGLTGVAIACYTVWDAHAVSALGISPLLFSWAGMVSRSVFLLPFAWRRRARLPAVWSEHRSAVLAVGLLSPLAYLLVLVAFTLAPVSHVAPAREVSIVIGTAFGTKLLGEGRGVARLAGALTVLAGVALLATG